MENEIEYMDQASPPWVRHSASLESFPSHTPLYFLSLSFKLPHRNHFSWKRFLYHLQISSNTGSTMTIQNACKFSIFRYEDFVLRFTIHAKQRCINADFSNIRCLGWVLRNEEKKYLHCVPLSLPTIRANVQTSVCNSIEKGRKLRRNKGSKTKKAYSRRYLPLWLRSSLSRFCFVLWTKGTKDRGEKKRAFWSPHN